MLPAALTLAWPRSSRRCSRPQLRSLSRITGAPPPGRSPLLKPVWNTYRNRVPLQNPRSFEPSEEPCDRFSELGTYATSAFQPARVAAALEPSEADRPPERRPGAWALAFSE